MTNFKESDWKVYRKLRETAMNRLCQRVLDEAAELASDDSRTPHQRYLKLYRLIQDRDKELANAFDGFSRSKAFVQIMTIHRMGLWEAEEFAQFSDELRASIEGLVKRLGS